MFVLITYDVSTQDSKGKKRLHKVAKACENYGVRVQNSVFECVVDSVKLVELKAKLETLIDKQQDSLRFYNLGNNFEHKVEHIGIKDAIRVTEPLIL